MDGGERWRMIRWAGGTQDKTIIDQIMLRFRPIAPKPATGAPDSDISSLNSKNLLLSERRTKRKYVRIRKNNKLFKRNQIVSSSSDQGKGKEREDGSFQKAVTLQLLPERSDDQPKDSTERGRSWCNLDLTKELVHDPENNQIASMWLKLKQPVICREDHQTVAMVPKKRLVLESWVTVESVMDTNGCMEGRELGCTDVERVKYLEKDTRPGFISDGSNRVRWVNGAYQRMVSVMKEKENEGQGQSGEIMVWLVTKEKLIPYMYSCAFTCWVRLQYAWKEKKYSSQMVPCDVWRMDCGGFAWRLDVEAALGLGR
ncbi:hypothetical protein P3X46_026296 [Hevea brasiliensis]|uniref:DUF7950 domain-containing protein n=1 Tax=Hevea brasiliensis TaxID=3981 RepID=A0ABQ9KZA4_HEVBR|nr:uncharacterized protein LOC110644659 [Hevea brasiliensis]KAJ9152770.1 hypothetical protein P3X46_026296 [Hevea brasiliensis]